MPVVTNNGPVFEYFNDLPAELRYMVIDEMGTVERIKFSRASKMSCREAKASKKFLYGLEVSGNETGSVIVIDVKYSENQGFHLLFNDDNGSKSIEYMTLDNKTKWITNLDNTIDLMEYAITHFKNLLEFYQHSIKSLRVSGELFITKLMYFDFGVRSFSNLEELSLDDATHLKQLLSKIRKPLKKLEILGEIRHEVLEDCEQIFRVQQCLHLPNVRFTNEQLLQSAASSVTIKFGELTTHDLVNFIRSWQDGTMSKNIEIYEWRNISIAAYEELFRALRVNPENGNVRLPHHSDLSKCAWLSKNWTSLVFKTRY